MLPPGFPTPSQNCCCSVAQYWCFTLLLCSLLACPLHLKTVADAAQWPCIDVSLYYYDPYWHVHFISAYLDTPSISTRPGMPSPLLLTPLKAFLLSPCSTLSKHFCSLLWTFIAHPVVMVQWLHPFYVKIDSVVVSPRLCPVVWAPSQSPQSDFHIFLSTLAFCAGPPASSDPRICVQILYAAL